MRKKLILLCLLLIFVLSISGCKEAEKDTEIVFTSEFAEGELFRIDNISCMLPEVNVYMRTTQDQYESVFGPEIWDKNIGDATLGEQIKDTILARLAQIKIMNLLAESYSLSLSEKETEAVSELADTYIGGLSKKEIEDLGIDRDIVVKMYSEYMLANKVYDEITKDVNPEISDDEARTISVKHILIKTYYLDENDEKVEFTNNQKMEALTKARNILRKIKAGEDFDNMAEKYNEDDEINYAFGKGTMPQSFEDAAFNLDTDEISDVVETEYGYHIIKCVSTFDRAQTDANKVKIVEERKNEAFNEVYDDFTKTLYSNINQEEWDKLTFNVNDELTTTNFFDVYNDYFE